MTTCFRVRKPIKVDFDWREPGELVPEAISWFRVEHLVHGGFIVSDEVPEDELKDALSYCPELAERYGVELEAPVLVPDAELVKALPVVVPTKLTLLNPPPKRKAKPKAKG